MALNLNEHEYDPDIGEEYDKDAIAYALRQLAPRWVPEVFTSGRIGTEGGNRAIRVADITGRKPKDKGSCRIWMTGSNAGDWVDFENEKKLSGQVLSTIKEHFGLKPGQVYRKAIE